jgi:toxin YoeB
LVKWTVVYARHAQKDAKKLAASGLKDKALELIAILEDDPFRNPPPFEKLLGDLAGTYSRRINIQHRLVYEVFAEQRIVRVLRMWSHYE